MVSWRACIWMCLTFMCGLAMRTSTAITCTISGQETRVNKSTVFNKNNISCQSTRNVQNESLTLTGQHGTLEYSYNGKKESLTLLLDNITSSTDYKKIHLLTCKNETFEIEGKLRFGQSIGDGNFATVFEYFQNHSSKQKCQCRLCRSNKCSAEACHSLVCNCIFSNDSIKTAVLFSEPHTTTTTTTTTTWPQTTTAPRTETITHSITTHIPATSEPTSTTDDSTSTKIGILSTILEPHSTLTTTTTTTWPQTTTAPRTETITHSITTHIPATSEPTSTTDDSTSTNIGILSTILEPHSTLTTTTTTTWPQTTTAPRTETITHSVTTHIPATSEPTSTTDDSTSTKIARQSNEESISTLAAVGGLIALVVIVSGVTVFVCLRRRKWNKKQSDYSEPCVTNPSYEDLQNNGNTNSQDNAGYEGNGNDVHTYDMADDQKLTTTGEQDYSYASFGGQSKFKDVMPTVNHDRYVGGRKGDLCHESPPTVQGNTGNAKLLIERDVTSENDDDYDLAKAVTGNKAVNSNSTTLPENYFNVEKTGHQPPPLRNNLNDNYFVHENDANERAEAMQTMKESFSPEGGNYFLVDESENAPSNEKSFTKETPAISKTGNGDITGIQGDNYFLLEQQTNPEENNQENGVYALAQSQSQTENGYGISRKNEQKQMKTDRDIDPYDHVRVGHAQTNGLDDGVYDELRKQNVRYESEEVDNDYDRCPATGHICEHLRTDYN
ncbi:probable serine/threonine-protein kinase nek3 isoform X3 [Mizuhopecten yessoensis]|uniref:Uncharacterized protein n=1 Tax=Mizuhopecten yessoensis TaxID=6573 RepID=A0A210PGA7_MIZYE|nr:probable serine/threonine-protein kinase nek3 isoform X3 [Mizuhopecten yessoensis]OWF35515.1 hypothetical protein KP79_PYT11394 [Mizuhopecten yessoensis]